jgi:hypothetical protein
MACAETVPRTVVVVGVRGGDDGWLDRHGDLFGGDAAVTVGGGDGEGVGVIVGGA